MSILSSVSNSYDVYIGNLSVETSREKLRNLFSEIGKILRIWINQKNKKFTYAFIAFYHLIDAKKACEQFNNRNLDGFIIKVCLSLKTEQKINNSVRKRTDDILLELPKRKGKKIPSKEDRIREILRDNLIKQNSKEFVKDFVNAMIDAENVCFKECEIIKTEPETPNLTTLETTVIRYFNANSKENSLFEEVDFDISKDNVITNKQNDKFFKIFLDTKK